MSHVTMHLWRVPTARIPQAIGRMGVDRIRLRGTPGMIFHKLLGTGDGTTFSPRDADLRTWGLVATWRTRHDSVAFEAHPTLRGWRRIAEEEWRADLRPLRSRGQWSGREPFVPTADPGVWDGPVASITRARLVARKASTFWRAVPPVVADLPDASGGPLLRVGIGEAPIGLQGTFTIWSSLDDLIDFAYRRTPHRQAIEDTSRLGWYAEEMFARFAVLGIRGTVFGVDLSDDRRGAGVT
ncbi:hypothetical protein [Euzebya tangerina]|uniref:hypothetical protein n=1 Tax=Euzebya tangerina TaxID=591198 RepID=UPI00196B06B5|nr:hypothetical protein [Euzebya tangerina]